jgi:hypothetical protein
MNSKKTLGKKIMTTALIVTIGGLGGAVFEAKTHLISNKIFGGYEKITQNLEEICQGTKNALAYKFFQYADEDTKKLIVGEYIKDKIEEKYTRVKDYVSDKWKDITDYIKDLFDKP